jgi:Uma2 family endonuclease
MSVTDKTFEQVVLEDPAGRWELHRGVLREKPPMTWNHTDVTDELAYLLRGQLPRRLFRVHTHGSRLRRSDDSYYMPDLAVIPTVLGEPLRDRPDRAELYSDPLPLVVEVWSPSTGFTDITSKVPEYQARGDEEIWRIHPFERTLTAWRRQSDGSYVEASYSGGPVEVASLPGVTINLDVLFEE